MLTLAVTCILLAVAIICLLLLFARCCCYLLTAIICSLLSFARYCHLLAAIICSLLLFARCYCVLTAVICSLLNMFFTGIPQVISETATWHQAEACQVQGARTLVSEPTKARVVPLQGNPAPLYGGCVDLLCSLQACENFTCYEKALATALGYLKEEMLQGGEDEEQVPVGERDPIYSSENFQKLQDLNELKRRIDKVCHSASRSVTLPPPLLMRCCSSSLL